MPIYEIVCDACSYAGETIAPGATDTPACPVCGAPARKLLAATSSLTGKTGAAMPGPADHGCCGSRPGQASHCAGPGSCCGKAGR